MEPRTSARASARLGRPAAVDRRSEDGRFPRGHVAHARSNSSDNRGPWLMLWAPIRQNLRRLPRLAAGDSGRHGGNQYPKWVGNSLALTMRPLTPAVEVWNVG